MKEVININESTVKKYVESLRPENIEVRKQIDIGYSFDGQVIELFEIRPIWKEPKKYQKQPFAKIRFYKSKKIWKLYWMRASGKWELYEPFKSSTHLSKIIDIIKEDKYGCFYG